MRTERAMKITKIVLGAQMAIIAVLLVVFVGQSGSSDHGEAAHGDYPPAAAASHDEGGHSDHDDAAQANAGGDGGAPHAAQSGPGHAEGHDPEPQGHGAELGDQVDYAPRPAFGLAPHRLGGPATAIAAALLAGNNRFVASVRSAHDLTRQRQKTVATQKPPAVVLGCADSRVPPELVFDRGIGELFVVRNAGNLATRESIGSIEYAVEHLHSKVLVVLGHEKCGAVTAALGPNKSASRNLRAVIDEITPAVSKLKGWADGGELLHMAVEANVRRQAGALVDRSAILRAAVAKNELSVLKAVYNLETGRVNPL